MSIERSDKIVIESVGCKVIFLLPYSLDLNPIEKFCANMKMWIRNQITQFAKSMNLLSLLSILKPHCK
ncbi:hypothetical protein [Orientia tsutsugamushi]|uniref:hypothetical protein n=1 Tax=Orientia tsutsugamushi TaxID=784 RepID=UPI0002FC756D|nr:hypothetical protein [Orientia tsutsugamushi]